MFAPQLLDTAVGDTLDQYVTVFNGVATYSSDNPAVKKVAEAYEREYPKGVPQQAVLLGYSEAQVMDEVLKKACDDKDLSREGLVKAFRELDAVGSVLSLQHVEALAELKAR